jgi:hypothetical protein
MSGLKTKFVVLKLKFMELSERKNASSKCSDLMQVVRISRMRRKARQKCHFMVTHKENAVGSITVRLEQMTEILCSSCLYHQVKQSKSRIITLKK